MITIPQLIWYFSLRDQNNVGTNQLISFLVFKGPYAFANLFMSWNDHDIKKFAKQDKKIPSLPFLNCQGKRIKYGNPYFFKTIC